MLTGTCSGEGRNGREMMGNRIQLVLLYVMGRRDKYVVVLERRGTQRGAALAVSSLGRTACPV